jgi:prepilin-type N-terminal cleavage/methylation domain-containing protein
MKMQGDEETRGQGDKETARSAIAGAGFPNSPVLRPLVPLSPCLLVSSRSDAFTLPEVLATLVLIGLVLPAVMKGVSLALAASDDARRRVEAVGLAENKLAEMAADAASNQGSGGGSGDFGDEAPGYHWEATSATVDTSLTEMQVRVTWTARGAERGVTLATYAYAGSSTTTESAAGPGGTP